MDSGFSSLFEWLKEAGLIGGLLVFVFGLHREWWVMGSQFRHLEATADVYKRLADRGTALAESATSVAQKVVAP